MVKKLCSLVFLGLLALAGCSTQKGPFLMPNIEYFPPEGLVAAKPKVVVGEPLQRRPRQAGFGPGRKKRIIEHRGK